MTPHTDWERFTVPSNHVWSVKKDETTGGYEAIVDIKRPVEMAISHAVAERTEEILRQLREEPVLLVDVRKDSTEPNDYRHALLYERIKKIISSLTPQETGEGKKGKI